MRAAQRIVTRTPVRAVELVRATCGVCSAPRALCATPSDVDAPICFACHLSMAQLIASHERASKRPDPKGCICQACVTFDEGQRGEIFNAALLDENLQPVSRWQVVEVD